MIRFTKAELHALIGFSGEVDVEGAAESCADDEDERAAIIEAFDSGLDKLRELLERAEKRGPKRQAPR